MVNCPTCHAEAWDRENESWNLCLEGIEMDSRILFLPYSWARILFQEMVLDARSTFVRQLIERADLSYDSADLGGSTERAILALNFDERCLALSFATV